MLTNKIQWLALAAAALTISSCTQEELGQKTVLGDEISFAVLTDTPQTKSLSEAGESSIIALFSSESQDTVYASVSAHEHVSMPMTKGVSVTTSSLSSFVVSAYNPTGGAYFSNEQVVKSASAWTMSSEYFWPASDALDFWAVNDPSKVSNMTHSNDGSVNKLSFSYTAPTGDATAQPDIIFAHTGPQVKSTSTQVGLTFKHALAEIRIAVSKTSAGTFKSATFKGMNDRGSADFKSDGTFTWTPSGERDFSQTFDKEVIKSDGTVLQPVYDEAAGELYMMVPQGLTGKKLEVVFNDGVSDKTFTADLTGEWKAGYVYTYKLSLNRFIELEVEDSVNATVKQNLAITNNGNVECYVRAAIVGNWMTAAGSLYGPWSSTSGTFTNLAPEGWVAGSDGYYYLKDSLEAGATASPKLFEKYTAPSSPASGVYLNMFIVVQAVKVDTNKAAAKAAWGETAAGYLN